MTSSSFDLMDYVLRPATAVDREWLWQTKRTCLRPYVEQTWGVWDEDAQRTNFDDSFEPSEVHIITVGDRDAGYISARNDPFEIRLFNIMIAPEFQNHGLGTAVLRQLQEVAHRLFVPVRLRVLRVNPARRLYERIGFKVIEDTATHYRMEWLPA